MPATKPQPEPAPRAHAEPDRYPIDAILHADALRALPELPAGCVHLTVFSPPYDGIRDYGKNWSLDYRTLGDNLFRVDHRCMAACIGEPSNG